MRQLGHDLRQTATAARDHVRRKIASAGEGIPDHPEHDALRRTEGFNHGQPLPHGKGVSVPGGRGLLSGEGIPVVQIALDPLLYAAARTQQNIINATAKPKTAEKVLREQIEKGKVELEYLESILEELWEAEERPGLHDIRAEVKGGGYLKQRKGEKKQVKRASSLACSIQCRAAYQCRPQ